MCTATVVLTMIRVWCRCLTFWDNVESPNYLPPPDLPIIQEESKNNYVTISDLLSNVTESHSYIIETSGQFKHRRNSI